MSTKTTNRRRQLRHAFDDPWVACVEFEHPSPNGRHFRLAVSDLSASGLSFDVSADDDLDLEIGSTLPGVQLRVSDCVVRGELVTMHMTTRPGGGRTCGALLYPESDDDLMKLKSLIAGMSV